jgi:hypothetical protein
VLAYVFWHRPGDDSDRAAYEKSLLGFQAALSKAAPPGLVAAASFAIEAVPWLGDRPGYEDWCLLEGGWAIDPLNAFAVAGAVTTPHDDIAHRMQEGHGGLYAHAFGDTALPADSSIAWLTRPRRIDWRAALEPLHAADPRRQGWRRQMVLGPAPEFAVVGEGEPPSAPAGWQVRVVKRRRLR